MKQVAERRNAEMQARMEFLEAEKESSKYTSITPKVKVRTCQIS